MTAATAVLPTPRLSARLPESWTRLLHDAFLQADAASQVGDERHKRTTLLDVQETLTKVLDTAQGEGRRDVAYRVERIQVVASVASQLRGTSFDAALGEVADKLVMLLSEEPDPMPMA